MTSADPVCGGECLQATRRSEPSRPKKRVEGKRVLCRGVDGMEVGRSSDRSERETRPAVGRARLDREAL